MKIGYIVSRYPAVSHTFVQREVLALRGLGWEVVTMSVRRAAGRELLTETDRAEAARDPGGGDVESGAVDGGDSGASAVFYAGTVFAGDEDGVAVLRRAGIKGAVWVGFYFVEALLVHRMLRREGIVHLHAHFANVASDVAMIAAVLGKGGVHNPKNVTFSFTMHGPTEFFDVKEHRLAEKAAAAKCVICISDYARSQLMAALGAGAVEQVAGFALRGESGAVTKMRAGRAGDCGGGRGRWEILCVARLAPVKGHAILLKVVEELALRGHDVHLTLIGDGPLRKSLEQLAEVMGISGRVTFLGSVGQDVIHTHFAKADVFVLPSFAEGVPVVLMEAMAAKCPVIATRINGIPELIEEGVTGAFGGAGAAGFAGGCRGAGVVGAAGGGADGASGSGEDSAGVWAGGGGGAVGWDFSGGVILGKAGGGGARKGDAGVEGEGCGGEAGGGGED